MSLVVVSFCVHLGVLHRKRRAIDKLLTGPATSAKLKLLPQTVVMSYRCPCTNLHCFTYAFPIHYTRTLYSANVHTFLGINHLQSPWGVLALWCFPARLSWCWQWKRFTHPQPFVEVDDSASSGVPSAVLDVDDLGLKWLPEVLPWSQACN